MKLLLAFPILALLLVPFLAHAEDLCESTESVHQRARYCHENWAFISPAKSCTATFSRLLIAEKARLQKILGGHVETGNSKAQKGNFNIGENVFSSSLDEVNYLIDYGKQVHTELEDYVSSLTPPVFEGGGGGDASNPAVKAQYMSSSECYSDPVNQLEEMQMDMRPEIAQLERAKKQLQLMAGINLKNNTHIENSDKDTKLPQMSAHPAGLPATVSGKHPAHESDVTGTLTKDHLSK